MPITFHIVPLAISVCGQLIVNQRFPFRNWNAEVNMLRIILFVCVCVYCKNYAFALTQDPYIIGPQPWFFWSKKSNTQIWFIVGRTMKHWPLVNLAAQMPSVFYACGTEHASLWPFALFLVYCPTMEENSWPEKWMYVFGAWWGRVRGEPCEGRSVNLLPVTAAFMEHWGPGPRLVATWSGRPSGDSYTEPAMKDQWKHAFITS